MPLLVIVMIFGFSTLAVFGFDMSIFMLVYHLLQWHLFAMRSKGALLVLMDRCAGTEDGIRQDGIGLGQTCQPAVLNLS